MKKILFPVLFLLCQLGFSQIRPLTPELAAELQTAVKAYKLNEISVAIMFPNDSIWQGCKGKNVKGENMDANTAYSIGSITKNFFAPITLKFVEEGKLSLDDTLYKYLPVMKNVSYGITIRQCLNHSTGLNEVLGTQEYLDFIKMYPDTIVEPDFLINKFLGPPFHLPGEGTNDYVNTNYILVGMVLCKISGLTIDELLHQYILDPLHLSNSSIFPDSLPANRAIPGTIPATTNAALHDVGPAGAMYSTPADLVRWSHTLHRRHYLADSTMEEIMQFHDVYTGTGPGVPPKYPMGLGICKMEFRRGADTVYVLGHPGGWGNVACMYYFPRDTFSIAIGYKLSYYNFELVQQLYDTLTLKVFSSLIVRNHSFRLFPIPAGNQINIQFDYSGNIQTYRYNIVDLYGRIVQSSEMKEVSSVDVSNLGSGIYFLELRKGLERIGVQKFLKE
ncbi:MAG: serine hydrolase [Bacteroidales bacterium]